MKNKQTIYDNVEMLEEMCFDTRSAIKSRKYMDINYIVSSEKVCVVVGGDNHSKNDARKYNDLLI